MKKKFGQEYQPSTERDSVNKAKSNLYSDTESEAKKENRRIFYEFYALSLKDVINDEKEKSLYAWIGNKIKTIFTQKRPEA